MNYRKVRVMVQHRYLSGENVRFPTTRVSFIQTRVVLSGKNVLKGVTKLDPDYLVNPA